MKTAQNLRRRVSQVSTLACSSDKLARSVIARTQYVYDLDAAKAKNSDCYNSFLQRTTGGKICRPESNSIA